MPPSTAIDNTVLRHWVEQKLPAETVRTMLQESGLDEETISQYLRQFRKLRGEKRQFTGFIILGIGSFLGLLSTILSLINPIPELFNLVLYGFTSVALVVIFLGLYFIFE